ncbi:uncharacterized mitochondrial protein-like protein [Tanacetum coccineum]
MNYIRLSLENQTNPHAGTSKVTNSAGTLQTPNANASEEEDEAEELIVVPTVVRHTKELILLGISQRIPPENPSFYERELDELAQKHLREVPKNKATSTTSVNSGSRSVNSQHADQDDSDMPELTIFNKPQKGIFDEGNLMMMRKSWCDEFEALMKGRFQMSSMGELIFFLGLQVKQKTDGLFISQDKYVAEMLKKFDLTSVKTAITPMETKMALTKDEEADDVDIHLYRSMIGSLMYLTTSRPDIMFVVCACSRFQVTPKTSHLNAVKRIFKYLKGKPNLGLWYPRESPFDLEAYSDSDYGGANLDRKSIADLLTKAFDGPMFNFLVVNIGMINP